MNLHEQCLLRYLKNPDELSYSTEILKLNNFILLRYLKNPDELSYSTEILKLNNFILEKRFIVKNFVAKSSDIRYTNKV